MDLIKKKEEELFELKQMFEKEQDALALDHALDLALTSFYRGNIKSLKVITNEEYKTSESLQQIIFELEFKNSFSIMCSYHKKGKCGILWLKPVNHNYIQLPNIGQMYESQENTTFLMKAFLVHDAETYAEFLKNLELFILKYLSIRKTFSLVDFSTYFHACF